MTLRLHDLKPVSDHPKSASHPVAREAAFLGCNSPFSGPSLPTIVCCAHFVYTQVSMVKYLQIDIKKWNDIIFYLKTDKYPADIPPKRCYNFAKYSNNFID